MKRLFSGVNAFTRARKTDTSNDKRIDRVGPETFRNVMREVTASVAIVAAGSAGARNGLTATAICSVSDDPPTLLACINGNTRTHEAIMEARCFSINYLCAVQQPIAEMFSGAGKVHGEERFQTGEWSTNLTGAPLLKDAVCSLECQLVDHKTVATHTIFFGELVGGFVSHDAVPLLYVRGGYKTLNHLHLAHSA